MVFAFSTTDRDSFLAIEDWKRKVEEEVGQISAVLVQNKTDLIAEAKMTSYVQADGRIASHRIASHRITSDHDLMASTDHMI